MAEKPMLVWLDLEMTGLSVDNDVILEIATVLTDNDLNEVAVGPNLIIHQSDEVLAGMNDWCVKQHTKSGLVAAVKASTISLTQAEDATLAFLKEQSEQGALLCGNSIGGDRDFLKHYMPRLAAFFGYRLLDVSAVKECVQRWYKNDPQSKFAKKDLHRALPDVYESIEELRHYKKYYFKA
jgi:oligoribonuclease